MTAQNPNTHNDSPLEHLGQPLLDLGRANFGSCGTAIGTNAACTVCSCHFFQIVLSFGVRVGMIIVCVKGGWILMRALINTFECSSSLSVCLRVWEWH
jgi:hypothetical protein